MITLRTNMSSIITQNSLTNSTNKLNQAIERMSTGYKINHASDNAANYSISNDMASKISSYEVAENNTAMGMDIVNTASENLSLMYDRLTRLRSLCEQACNGTYGKSSISAIKDEAQAHVDEFKRLYNNTEYNGLKLFGEFENRGFLAEIEVVTPDVTVSEASELLDAINNNSIIGIANADVLHELANVVNSGLNTCNGKTIILTDDIDLSDYQDHWTRIGIGSDDDRTKAFQGTFDGQGHVITNFKSTHAIFDVSNNAVFKNVAVIDCNVHGDTNYRLAALIGNAYGGEITNCYSTGSVSGKYAGGLVCRALLRCKVTNSYSTADVTAIESAGGLVSAMNATATVEHCYATGNVTCDGSAGGLVGRAGGITSNTKYIINDCYATGNVAGGGGVGGISGYSGHPEYVYITNSFCTGNVTGIGESASVGSIAGVEGINTIENCSAYGTTTNNGVEIVDEYTKDSSLAPKLWENETALQVGINADSSSQISFRTDFNIVEIEGIVSAIDKTSTLDKIDKLIKKISSKQTELGSVNNRLDSALESISVCRDNLVSSRSTIKNADIAKESSAFIKAQILQQAAATLMSTANQSPAIALQLI